MLDKLRINFDIKFLSGVDFSFDSLSVHISHSSSKLFIKSKLDVKEVNDKRNVKVIQDVSLILFDISFYGNVDIIMYSRQQ